MRGVLGIVWLGLLLAGPLRAEGAAEPPSEPRRAEEQAAEPPSEPLRAEEAAEPPSEPRRAEEQAAEPPSAPNPDAPPAPRETVATLGASYFGAFTNRSDPLANLGFSLAIPFGSDDTLTVSQGFTKYFYLEGDRREYEAQDTVLSFARKVALSSFKASAQFDLTVPTSKYSQAQRVHSKPRIALQVGGPSWSETITWRFGGFFRYYVNEFKTTRFETNAGGDPLPWMQYGASFGLSRSFGSDWDLSLSGAYSEIQYERDTGLEEVVSYERMADHPYSVDVSLSHSFNQSLSGTLGYSNGSQVEAFGGTDFVIFDDDLAVWYLATTITL